MTKELFHFDFIIEDLKANNTKQVFRQLAKQVHTIIGTLDNFLVNALSDQEKKQGSGIGHGVAVANMCLPRLTKPMIIFAKLSTPVDFHSNDGELVDMVCLVLSPEFEGLQYLGRLAKMVRLLSSKSLCKKLRQCDKADQIRMVIQNLNDKKMAA